MNANHPFAKRDKIPLIDLRNEDFVLFPEGYIMQKLAVEACNSVGFSPKVSSEGEDMDAIKGLVAAGIGLTLLPESTFYDSTPRFTKKIPIELPNIRRTVGIISPATGIFPLLKRFFNDFVIQFFSLLGQYQ